MKMMPLPLPLPLPLLLLLLLLLVLLVVVAAGQKTEGAAAVGVGVNWGTQASQRLPSRTVVQMLKDNNFTRVKLFDTDPLTLSALAGSSSIEVMVAIPNLYLQDMTDLPTAKSFVQKNISRYLFQGGVNIK